MIGRLGRIGHGELKGEEDCRVWRNESMDANQAFPGRLTIHLCHSSRLEHSAEQEKPPVPESPAEGNVPDVRHLGLRYSQHPQRVLGCHGAPGVLFHHAR